MYVCVYIYIYIYIYIYNGCTEIGRKAPLGTPPQSPASRWGRDKRRSCHILPFQPILWNKDFPSEPAKPPKTAQNIFQRGVEYGKYERGFHKRATNSLRVAISEVGKRLYIAHYEYMALAIKTSVLLEAMLLFVWTTVNLCPTEYADIFWGHVQQVVFPAIYS